MTAGQVAFTVGAVLLGLTLGVWLLRVASTLGPHCRCGHHRSTHRMPDTGCVGYWSAGWNAIGAKQWEPCTCQAYRPTGVGWWQRVQHGTEEREIR